MLHLDSEIDAISFRHGSSHQTNMATARPMTAANKVPKRHRGQERQQHPQTDYAPSRPTLVWPTTAEVRCAREPDPTVLMTTSFALHDPNATSAEGPLRHFCHVAHFRFRGKRTSFTKVNSAAPPTTGSRSNRAAKRPLDRARTQCRHFGSRVTLSLAWPKTFALSSQLLKPRRRPWRKRSGGSRPASRRRSVRRSQPSSGWPGAVDLPPPRLRRGPPILHDNRIVSVVKTELSHV